ncbi:hypothetical protein T484DRAFT_3631779 [Baffinella frigidus]|nr:hypothetical protein T484DRAFT_3631779 [Cryptophyta sp. CCMP2293]
MSLRRGLFPKLAVLYAVAVAVMLYLMSRAPSQRRPSRLPPSTEQSPSGEASTRGLRLAVGIVGRLSRFSFETFADNVVAPNNSSTLDVFAYLTNGGFDCKYYKDWTNATIVDWPTIERDFGAIVEGAGARLMSFETKPQTAIAAIVGDGRLHSPELQKPGMPCAVAQRDWNWYQLHRMLLAEEVAGGFFYDVVLLLRDDAFFFQPMHPLAAFNRSAVSVKGCMRFGGLNDKVAVLPRRFASAWLQAFVQHYVDPLHTKPNYQNPEQFAKNVADTEGIPIVEPPNEWLPMLDIRELRTSAGEHGRLRQEGGCFRIGGFPMVQSGPPSEMRARCACVAEGHCEAGQDTCLEIVVDAEAEVGVRRLLPALEARQQRVDELVSGLVAVGAEQDVVDVEHAVDVDS